MALAGRVAVGALSVDPRSGKVRWQHLHENTLQRAVKETTSKMGSTTQLSGYMLRHAVAIPLPEEGDDIRTVQELLGHAEVATTMIDTYVLNTPGLAGNSPAHA
jgi:site-specific recombinase XerD